MSSISDTENQTKSSVAIKFLVLPTNPDDNVEINETALLKLIEKFWSFEKFCLVVNAGDSFFNSVEDFFDNCKNSFWSTFYPDPKSDLNFKNNNYDFESILNLNYRL